MATTRREAAAILRRIIEALDPPAGIAAYLRGHADALEARRGSVLRRERGAHPAGPRRGQVS